MTAAEIVTAAPVWHIRTVLGSKVLRRGFVLHCAHSVAANAPAPRRWLHSGAAGARYRPLECRRADYPRVRAEELERGELLAAARRYYPSGAGRIGYQRCFRADGAGLKVAAAVGTGAAREPFDASWASWAFKSADECLVSRRKVTVAAFAVGSNLKHGAIFVFEDLPAPERTSTRPVDARQVRSRACFPRPSRSWPR